MAVVAASLTITTLIMLSTMFIAYCWAILTAKNKPDVQIISYDAPTPGRTPTSTAVILENVAAQTLKTPIASTPAVKTLTVSPPAARENVENSSSVTLSL